MRNKRNQQDALDRALLIHIEGLGLSSIDAYRDWCSENGFSRKLKKHWKQLCRERSFSQQAVANARLTLSRREKRQHAGMLDSICMGDLTEDDVALPHLKRLCEIINPPDVDRHWPTVDRASLQVLLSHLNRCRAKFFDGTPVVASLGQSKGNTYVEALALIAAHSDEWKRPIEQWRPRSHSATRQFASLLRHLFVRYDDVPLFFDSVWFEGRTDDSANRQRWYLHVGRGKNIRECKLPIPITKKMAHHFMRAPNDLTLNEAIRWGQVLGIGGDERLARAVLGTRLAENFDNDEFWVSVIRWFVQHPLLDRSQVGPIVDYLNHQKFVPQRLDRGTLAAAQPNLSMRGRNPETLLRQVDEWHRVLQTDNRYQTCQWQSVGLDTFEFLEGSEKNGTLKCWTIRELLSSKSLAIEGRQLRHCVATYAFSCTRGHSSIWTMEVETMEGVQKKLTIEVRNSSKLICQIRGKANRLPTDKERSVIQRWADSSGLTLASYA